MDEDGCCQVKGMGGVRAKWQHDDGTPWIQRMVIQLPLGIGQKKCKKPPKDREERTNFVQLINTSNSREHTPKRIEWSSPPLPLPGNNMTNSELLPRGGLRHQFLRLLSKNSTSKKIFVVSSCQWRCWWWWNDQFEDICHKTHFVIIGIQRLLILLG